MLVSGITVENYRPQQRERRTDAPNLPKAIPNTARDAADHRGGDPKAARDAQRWGVHAFRYRAMQWDWELLCGLARSPSVSVEGDIGSSPLIFKQKDIMIKIGDTFLHKESTNFQA